MQLTTYIESLIFASPEPISLEEIKNCLVEYLDQKIEIEELIAAVEELQIKYSSDAFAFEIVEINGGFLFMTKSSFSPIIETYLKQSHDKKLSKSALETLSIIAYRQPVVKSDLEFIRGVNCDYAVQKLLEKDLIEIAGRADSPGKPMLYKTSEKFMNYFGLKSIKDLPQIKEFTKEEEIGQES